MFAQHHLNHQKDPFATNETKANLIITLITKYLQHSQVIQDLTTKLENQKAQLLENESLLSKHQWQHEHLLSCYYRMIFLNF